VPFEILGLFEIRGGETTSSGIPATIRFPQSNGYVCRIEQISRENNNGLYQSAFNHLATDGALGAVCIQYTVGKNKTGHAVAGELADHIENPVIVGVGGRRCVVTISTRGIGELIFNSPICLIERWACHDEVGFQCFL